MMNEINNLMPENQRNIKGGQSYSDYLAEQQLETPTGSIDNIETVPSKEFVRGLSNGPIEFSNMFVPEREKRPIAEAKGVAGVAGEVVGQLLNPVNLAIGVATGGVSEVAGALTTGIARGIAVGASEFTGGLGYTLADHYQKKLSNFDDKLSTAGLLAGGAIGGVFGTALHSIAGFRSFEDAVQLPDQAMKDLSGFMHTNPDLPLVNYGIINNLEYNPQSKDVYKLNFEAGDKPDIIPAEIPKEDTLTRLGLDSNSPVINDDIDMNYINRAKELEAQHINLKDVSTHLEYSNNEFDARYSQMLNDEDADTVAHIMNPKNDFNIRKAINGELIGLSETDIKAGVFYNKMMSKLIIEANDNGIEIGYRNGYIRQVHDTDRMRTTSPQEWIDFIKPRLSNDIDDATLKKTYEKLMSLDVDNHFTPDIQQKSVKARVFEFKDARSAIEYEGKYGYKKLIGTHLVDNINALKHHIVLKRVVGTDNPATTLKYLGKLNRLTKNETSSYINDITNISPPMMGSLLGKGVSSLLTASRLANSLAKPFSTLITKLPLDFSNAIVQSIGKYGIGNTMKGILSKPPTEDLKYLANLPYKQKETFANIIGSLKQEAKLEHLDIMGARVTDKTGAYLKLAQRSYLKIGGMHMLDNMTRKLALKLANTAIKNEYAINGLEKLLPGIDKKILAKAVNKEGELVPYELDRLANSQTNETTKQKYRDVSTRLKTLYAKSINDANPIYSPLWKQFNKYDPAVASGARSMLWAVRMYHATYMDLLTQVVYGDKKIRAGATIFATASALATLEMGYNHLINAVMGKDDAKETTGSTDVDSIINHSIDNPLIQDYTKSMVKHAVTFTGIYNAPIWYGSGYNALRAGVHYMEDDPDKAQTYINKAVPMLGATINAWSYIND